MTIDDWFTWAATDAEQRELPALKPLLEGLRHATRELREADWNEDAASLVDTVREGKAESGRE
jgi:hypothetical protein